MRTKICLVAVLLVAFATVAGAQSVKHIQTKDPGGIATGVWVGDMFYLSGQLPSPVTPANRGNGTPAVYGNTQQQAENVFNKIKDLLKEAAAQITRKLAVVAGTVAAVRTLGPLMGCLQKIA